MSLACGNLDHFRDSVPVRDWVPILKFFKLCLFHFGIEICLLFLFYRYQMNKLILISSIFFLSKDHIFTMLKAKDKLRYKQEENHIGISFCSQKDYFNESQIKYVIIFKWYFFSKLIPFKIIFVT